MRALTNAYMTDPMIYGMARHITAGLPDKAWSAEMNALFYFVRDRIRYVFDPLDCEGLQTPVETLKLGSGDCDDKCMLLGAMLKSIGHPVQFVAVQIDGSPDYTHVFLRTRIGPHWISLETTEKWVPGQVSPRITGKAIVKDV